MKKPLIIFAMLTLSTVFGCATTKQVEPAAPVEAPKEVTAPEPASAPIEQPQEVKPVISEELQSLFDAISTNDNTAINAAARVIIDKSPASDDAVKAYNALATSALSSSPDTARLYIERASELAPDDPQVLLTLGRVAHAQNQDDEALSHFQKASEKSPKDASACIESAKILITYLDLARALESAQCAHSREPKRCDAIAIYADALYANKSYEDAATAYENYINNSCATSEDILRNLAKLNETHLNNAKRACEVYSMLTDLSPDNANYKASRDYNCNNNQ